MALKVNIIDTEYKKIDGRDHLYYQILIEQPSTNWHFNHSLRYSEMR